jgi:hypothetical protein
LIDPDWICLVPLFKIINLTGFAFEGEAQNIFMESVGYATEAQVLYGALYVAIVLSYYVIIRVPSSPLG